MEERVPLSKSRLWERQRHFYEQRGIEAWSYGVPYYATCNPNIANSYANVIVNFIQEIKKKQASPAQPNTPVYIVELGTGSGAFSFYTLKRLWELVQSLRLAADSFVYVMTDLVESNLEFWSCQPVFKEYVDRGLLDFACFDLENDTEIRLQNSNLSISATAGEPVVFIANYLFDTLRHDVFMLEEGRIYEGVIKPDPQIGEFLPNQGMTLAEIDGGLSYRPVTLPYYHDPDIDNILLSYQTGLENRSLLFPIGSIYAIKRLRELTGDRFFLMATDKAYSRHFEYYEQAAPDLVFHDRCFSMTVNFHAIGRYFQESGGDCYHQDTQQSIITSAFILGGCFPDLPATTNSLQDYLGLFSPGNLLTLYGMIEATRFSCSLEHMVAYLSTSHWDPWVFNSYLDAILQKVKSVYVTKSVIYDLCNGMKKVAENVYHLPGQTDTLANIGLFFQEICRYEEALDYYQKSVVYGGKNDTTMYNMGLCYIFLNQFEQAMQMFKEAVVINPGYIMAKGWIAHIQDNI